MTKKRGGTFTVKRDRWRARSLSTQFTYSTG